MPKTKIEDAAIKEDAEVEGGGLFGVIDESNWLVCEQSPAPAEVVTGAPRLTVDRSCGGEPTEDARQTKEATEEQASEEPTTEEPTTEEPEDTTEAEQATPTAEPLTVENSPEFASILALTDYCSPRIQEFADDHQGETIRFDGYIGAMAPHGSYDSRYNILVGVGNFSETSAPGPQFQFRDVNVVSDLELTGEVPDTIGVGQHLDITAEVKEFEANSCLLLLEPISSGVRE